MKSCEDHMSCTTFNFDIPTTLRFLHINTPIHGLWMLYSMRENYSGTDGTAIFECHVSTRLARAVAQSVKRLPILLIQLLLHTSSLLQPELIRQLFQKPNISVESFLK